MFIAIVKALCVMLVFMHLKSERGLIYKFLFFTVVFVIGLFVLTYLGWSDPLVSHIIPTH
jgi:caa(3)-type oxidase subunit IV